MAKSLDDIINEAVEDFATNGYRSQAQLDEWLRRLRDALEASLGSRRRMEQMLNEAMRAVYERMVNVGAYRVAPGIARRQVAALKPTMRMELQRRILASANLIKLNREQTILETLSRFSGWMTSVPKGGASDEFDMRKFKWEAKKPLRSLSFRERRVLIDQSHKFASSLEAVIATDQGAIAAKWLSHWKQSGYDYREDHRDRALAGVFLIRGSWAAQKGLVKVGAAGYTDEVTQPGEEVFCFPGETSIEFADCVEMAYRRRYRGELAQIVTASGKSLRGTPNHPILTTNGWVAIGALKKGDYVIEVADQTCDGVAWNAGKTNRDHAVSGIANVFDAISEIGVAEKRRGHCQQFHGDGTESDVDIVRAERSLRFSPNAFGAERHSKFSLPESDNLSASVGAFDLFADGGFGVASRVVSGARQTLSSLGAFSLHANAIGGAGPAQIRTERVEAPRNNVSRNSEPTGHGEDAFPVFVSRQIVETKRHLFHGYVYNLQTESDWYVAGGIISHNCRCKWIYVYNLRSMPADMLTKKGAAALAKAKIE